MEAALLNGLCMQDVVPDGEQDKEIKQMAKLLMYGASDSNLPELADERPRLQLSVRQSLLPHLSLMSTRIDDVLDGRM